MNYVFSFELTHLFWNFFHRSKFVLEISFFTIKINCSIYLYIRKSLLPLNKKLKYHDNKLTIVFPFSHYNRYHLLLHSFFAALAPEVERSKVVQVVGSLRLKIVDDFFSLLVVNCIVVVEVVDLYSSKGGKNLN